MKRATGDDDLVLAETSWPLPDDGMSMLVHHMSWNNPIGKDRGVTAAAIITAYRALIMDGTTAQQTKRLAALRRVHRRKP